MKACHFFLIKGKKKKGWGESDHAGQSYNSKGGGERQARRGRGEDAGKKSAHNWLRRCSRTEKRGKWGDLGNGLQG